jgi:hypothetical protein
LPTINITISIPRIYYKHELKFLNIKKIITSHIRINWKLQTIKLLTEEIECTTS